ncbi:hypothetical protein K4G99_22520, partial [Mycobacterium tuberculosis]|nr:hypothetical protein [Mycobacterium tuberculosis]
MEQGIDFAGQMPTMQQIPAMPTVTPVDPAAAIRAGAEFWADTMSLWQRFLDPAKAPAFEETPEQARDKRFKAAQWREQPVFDFIRQSYL